LNNKLLDAPGMKHAIVTERDAAATPRDHETRGASVAFVFGTVTGARFRLPV